MVIEIDGGALGIGCRYDSQAEQLMLDGLAFLHYLHNFLLGTTRCLVELSKLEGPRPLGDLPNLQARGL